MNKIENRIYSKNYKKAFICFIIVAVIFVVSSVSVCICVFGGRLKNIINTMEQNERVKTEETLNKNVSNDEQNDNNKHKHKEKFSEKQIKEIMNLSAGEKILIGTFCMVGGILFIWFWLLIVALTIKAAYKIGANQFLFGWLAMFINIGALIILYIYKNVCRVCDNCARVQSGKSTYCSNCGNKLVNVCSECGHHGSKKDIYCSQCGKKY